MTESVPLIFDILTEPSSSDYMNFLLKPYAGALEQINVNDGAAAFVTFKNWISLTFSEKYKQQLLNILTEDNELVIGLLDTVNTLFYIDAIKALILAYLGNSLINYIKQQIDGEIITPWDLIEYRNDDLIEIFGMSANKLPIIVVINSKMYEYSLTEEFVLGLLISLNDNNNVTLLFMGNILMLSLLLSRYIERKNKKYQYEITIINSPNYNIYFNTPELIQGILTGSQWLNIDYHNIVENLTMINEKGDEIMLEF